MKVQKTLVYYASFITVGFYTGAIGPTLPGLADQTGSGLSSISLLFPALFTGYLLGSLVSGFLYDRRKSHPILAFSLIVLMLSMTMIPVLSTFWFIMVAFFCIGLASGFIDVGGNTLVLWIHREHAAPYMVGLHLCFGIGAFVAPMIVGLMLQNTGTFAWSYWILAIICVPIILGFLFTTSPTHQPTAHTSGNRETRYLFILLMVVFMFLHVGTEVSFGSWIYTYARTLGLASVSSAAYLTSAYWGALMVGRVVSVAVSLKMKPETMLVVYLSGCIAAVLLLLLGSGSVVLVWTASIMLGFSMAPLIPATFTYAGRWMDISGKIASWFVIGLGTGNMFFPWLVGQLFEPVGPHMLPVINITALALALVLILATIGMLKSSGRPVRE